jgi:hypothetical protein
MGTNSALTFPCPLQGFDVSFTPRFVLSGRNGYKCDEKFGAGK